MWVIEQLFGSKTRVKLLQLFFTNPNRPFYVREITRKIEEQINSVRRELANLLEIGIITSENTHNRLYYEVNQKYHHYPSLAAIFGSVSSTKTSHKADNSKSANDLSGLKSLGHVEVAIYTGQFTRDETSGIDLLIVGDVNNKQLQNFVEDLEAKESKQIRYTLMPLTEFEYRQQVNDRFLSNVLSSKKQVLVDRQNILSQAPIKSVKNKQPKE